MHFIKKSILSIVVLFGLVLSAQTTFAASAPTTIYLQGAAWSEYTGWIFLGPTPGATPPINTTAGWTGVTADANTGLLSGYGWSPNVGWVNFAPTNIPTNSNTFGVTPTQAKFSPAPVGTTGELIGWARACGPATGSTGFCNGPSTQAVAGWDGWIALKGKVPAYGVTFTSTTNTTTGVTNYTFSGYGWGDDIMGWIDFKGVTATSTKPPTNPVLGCTDPAATNYNPLATQDDGSCVIPQPVLGCTNLNATNYNPLATQDDGSCVYPPNTLDILYIDSTNSANTNQGPMIVPQNTTLQNISYTNSGASACFEVTTSLSGNAPQLTLSGSGGSLPGATAYTFTEDTTFQYGCTFPNGQVLTDTLIVNVKITTNPSLTLLGNGLPLQITMCPSKDNLTLAWPTTLMNLCAVGAATTSNTVWPPTATTGVIGANVLPLNNPLPGSPPVTLSTGSYIYALSCKGGSPLQTVTSTLNVTVLQPNDPLCAPPVLGCTNPGATNYNPLATQDDGSCLGVPPQPGGPIKPIYIEN